MDGIGTPLKKKEKKYFIQTNQDNQDTNRNGRGITKDEMNHLLEG